MQVDALERQRKWLFDQLEPSKLQKETLEADTALAKQRLALQKELDPELYRQRFAAEEALTKQLEQIGGAPSDIVARKAMEEGLAGVAGLSAVQKRLIDAAMEELNAGATLPPDVQNELVRTGLERAGQTTPGAGTRAFGGQILRKVIGQEGIALKAARQARALALSQGAQQLEQSRQSILQQLFPNLQAQQMNNINATKGILAASNQMIPEAGLSGHDVANIWLARVGASNQLAQSSADIASRGALAQSQIWQQGIGGAIGGFSQGGLSNLANKWINQALNPSSGSPSGGSGVTPVFNQSAPADFGGGGGGVTAGADIGSMAGVF
jgi:hypothetical protein